MCGLKLQKAAPSRGLSDPGLFLESEGGNATHQTRLLTLMGVAPADIALDLGRVAITLLRVREGDALFQEGMMANAIYFVRAGVFKSFHLTEDGYEQVVAFVGRAEVLGYDAVCMRRHPTSAVALEESSVFVVSMDEIVTLGQRSPALDCALRMAVSRQLQRSGELADLMSAVASEARLSRFLLQYSQRMQTLGRSPSCFYLRMSRRDIASYLGVAHETISRCFGTLARSGYLAVKRREVEILDMEGLRNCSRGVHRVPSVGASSSNVTRISPTGYARMASWVSTRPVMSLSE